MKCPHDDKIAVFTDSFACSKLDIFDRSVVKPDGHFFFAYPRSKKR